MKLLATAILIFLPSFSFAAVEVYEQEASGYGNTKNKACEEALLYAKKEALDYSGVIVRQSVRNHVEVNNKLASKISTVDTRQLSNGIVRVINKSIEVKSDENGIYFCTVFAKLAVDSRSVLQNNKAYEGQLPDWVVVPPRVLGKRTIIEHSKSLDGAIAAVLYKLSDIRSLVAKSVRRYQKEHEEAGGERPDPVETKLTSLSSKFRFGSNLEIEGRENYFYEKNATHSKLSVNLIFNKNGGRAILLNRYFSFDDADENVSVEKDAATQEMLFDYFVTISKKLGFTIEYEQVVSGDTSEWYVMLIGE